MKINSELPVWQWFTLIFLAFIWGSSFFLIKQGLKAFSPYQVAAFRVVFTFLWFIPLFVKEVKKIRRHHIFPLFISGLFGSLLPYFFFPKAQEEITSALSGMLNSLTPVFTFIIGIFLVRSKTRLVNILGLVLGLFGAIGLIYSGSNNVFEGNNWYGVYALMGAACYGININTVKTKLSELKGLTITVVAFGFIVLPALVYLVFSDFSNAQGNPHLWPSLIYVFLLATFSSALAVLIFNNLIQRTTSLFASSVTYIIPVFAILWGLFDGETISLVQFVAIGFILLGVYLVNKRFREK